MPSKAVTAALAAFLGIIISTMLERFLTQNYPEIPSLGITAAAGAITAYIIYKLLKENEE